MVEVSELLTCLSNELGLLEELVLVPSATLYNAQITKIIITTIKSGPIELSSFVGMATLVAAKRDAK